MIICAALAYGNSEEVKTILENVILLVNVVQNPDGRVMGTRRNAKGVDLNRDFITQTQPETQATVKVITEWNPMVFLDLHDDVQPMLIEPCSPPHNPNYEYDLYIQWALYQAYAMEAELIANTDETEALIPFRDWDFTVEGYTWDDWPAIYTPMYAMYHGAYGHTIVNVQASIEPTMRQSHRRLCLNLFHFVCKLNQGRRKGWTNVNRDHVQLYQIGAQFIRWLPERILKKAVRVVLLLLNQLSPSSKRFR